jgi:hypothetical protein
MANMANHESEVSKSTLNLNYSDEYVKVCQVRTRQDVAKLVEQAARIREIGTVACILIVILLGVLIVK